MLILAIIIFVIGANYKNQPSTGKKTALLVLGIITLVSAIVDVLALVALVIFRFASEMEIFTELSGWIMELIKETLEDVHINIELVGSAFDLAITITIVVVAIETVLGFIASIFALVRQSNKELAAQASAQKKNVAFPAAAGGSKICANCGQVCQPSFYVCPRCGSSNFNQPGMPQQTVYMAAAPQQPQPAQPYQQPQPAQPYQQPQPAQPYQQSQPMAQPAQPAVQPEQPIAQPEQPTVQPEQPTVQPEQPMAQPEQAAAALEWFCTSCGKSNPAEGKFCSSCGSKNPNT